MAGGEGEPLLWDSLIFISRARQGVIKGSGESLSEDIELKARQYTHQSNLLRGRQILWLMINVLQKAALVERGSTHGETSSLSFSRVMTTVNGSTNGSD